MTNDRKRVRAQRRRLWQEDPHCRRCGVATILPEELNRLYGSSHSKKAPRELLDTMATIEHPRTRYHPGRRDGVPHILLCRKCNIEQAAQQEASQPIAELWRRSGSYPLVWRGRGKIADGPKQRS